MQSSASQETSSASQISQRKRAPAWSNNEVLDLIAVWGEESVMLELRNNKRNANTFGRISKAMLERGHNRDAQQCRVKIKELRQAFQKAKEANGRSGAPPQTCKFYDELNDILGGAPTTTAPLCVDSRSSEGIIIRHEEDSDDEDEDEEGNSSEVREATGETLLAYSQELFVTLDPIPSQSSHVGAPASDETSGGGLSQNTTPSVISCRPAPIRKRKKRTRDDMFTELLQNSQAESARQAEWREKLLQSKQEARAAAERREERKQQQEERREERRQQEENRRVQEENRRLAREEARMDAFLRIMEDQSQMLRTLVKQRSPLKPLANQLPPSTSPIASPPKRGVRTRGGKRWGPTHSTPEASTSSSRSFSENF